MSSETLHHNKLTDTICVTSGVDERDAVFYAWVVIHSSDDQYELIRRTGDWDSAEHIRQALIDGMETLADRF